jgi:hypothetical protein
LLLIAALAIANRSYITRALQFPASIAYPVPVSPA